MTGVGAPAVFVCFRMTVTGSRPKPLYEQPADDPRRYTTALDCVLGVIAFGLVLDFDGGEAPHLCASLAGCTPACGEPHLLFPPGARPW